MKNKKEPKIVAKYGGYVIQQGVTTGKYFVHLGNRFIGTADIYANAIGLISLKEGQAFDINKVEALG